MNCNHARKLFAAFWDDESTLAEREWLEGHFTSCESCRREYEQYARTLELVASLPRVEPSPGLHERVLARVRRADPVPDRMPAVRPVWVPIGSVAAAALIFAFTLAGPWLGTVRNPGRVAEKAAPVSQPVLVETPAVPAPGEASREDAMALATGTSAATDSLFDHSEDVEFILDPVTLHRGRASVTRTAGTTRDERAVITF